MVPVIRLQILRLEQHSRDVNIKTESNSLQEVGEMSCLVVLSYVHLNSYVTDNVFVRFFTTIASLALYTIFSFNQTLDFLELYWGVHKMNRNIQNQAWKIVRDQEVQDMSKILPQAADIIPLF